MLIAISVLGIVVNVASVAANVPDGPIGWVIANSAAAGVCFLLFINGLVDS